MTGEELLQAIAAEWGSIQRDLGPELPEFESKLLPLLRALEAAPEDPQAMAAVLELLGAYPRIGAGFRITKGAAFRCLNAERHRYVQVPVFFGTGRERVIAGGPGYFGVARGLGNSYGVAQVSIPDDHRMGKLEKPRWWRLEFRPDPEQHVVVLAVDSLSRSEFVNRARTAVADAPRKTVLLFVHGFNVTFENALRRAAQLAYDLDFPGLASLYSWPSEGAIQDYMVDSNNVTWAEPHFQEFLQLLREETGADAIHIVSHSMGTRLIANTLQRLASKAVAARLSQVILAAPDIDSDVFRQLSEAFPGKADRITLYASSEDWALAASKRLQKYARAGDSGQSIVIVPHVDSIDASAVSTGFLKHSYFGDSDSLLGDLFALIGDGSPPPRFKLRKRTQYGETYWVFVP
jgi:esterase/lipase superfamily enzyme